MKKMFVSLCLCVQIHNEFFDYKMVADECSALRPRPFIFLIQERYSTLKSKPKGWVWKYLFCRPLL